MIDEAVESFITIRTLFGEELATVRKIEKFIRFTINDWENVWLCKY